MEKGPEKKAFMGWGKDKENGMTKWLQFVKDKFDNLEFLGDADFECLEGNSFMPVLEWMDDGTSVRVHIIEHAVAEIKY